jgi:hypothetical protein
MCIGAIPERKLLAAMDRTEGVVDVEDLKLARLHGGAEQVNESCTQPRRLSLARCILEGGRWSIARLTLRRPPDNAQLHQSWSPAAGRPAVN